ncbi:MAG: ATP-binding cassette domain-containing protein, partial [Candidatus Izemoplasmatales bacterium]|nr:ATP-binding cassette domain-containing protein [Candidatus Izemoplasmatales bacterium]
NVSKDYKVGETNTHALIDINLEFKQNEFVSILGPSGCGKTTMLNIIGGLDQYQKGDLVIDGISTKEYKDKDWDSYRNSTIGFVFQNYNLISHLSVLDNVEIALTLSGVSRSERLERAKKVLIEVDLGDQIHKKPNQLSGGQMQRVAIARAMVNNPRIILADEPTGALDSKTSVPILDLLKKISEDRLVIMVTHNVELAEIYSDRIVKLLDGRVLEDSRVFKEEVGKVHKSKPSKKISMSYMTALKSSFKNLTSKKTRTLITAIAGSIGIIGIALVLALSYGMTSYVNTMQSDTLAGFPLTINQTVSITNDMLSRPSEHLNDLTGGASILSDFPDTNIIYSYDSQANSQMHTNLITQDYLDYINGLDSTLYNSISYSKNVALNVIAKTTTGGYIKVDDGASSSQFSMYFSSSYFSEIPNSRTFIESQYDLLGDESRYPTAANEVVLIVDKQNRVDIALLDAFGISVTDEYTLDDFIGMQFYVASNNDYYSQTGFTFVKSTDYQAMAESENSIAIQIVGIMRVKEEASSEVLDTGIGYTTMLTDLVLENALTSDIVVAQEQSTTINVLTGLPFNDLVTYQNVMQVLGGDSLPSGIQIYPVSFEAKDQIKTYLDAYNSNLNSVNQVIYSDLAETISGVISTLISTITLILSAFAAISLVVSSIMIGIITYVSVVERTKEIGILRSIGARKKDISRVFNAETIIIGFTAGLIGILVSLVLILPINALISKAIGISNFASLPIYYALALISISIILTFIAGLIPSRIAANKDPVVALRTE